MEEWIVPWCCFLHRQCSTDSSLLHSRKKTETKFMSETNCLKLQQILIPSLYIRGSAEKFIGWQRYSHGIWPNWVYFSTWSSLLSSHFFDRCFSAWIPLVKKLSATDMMSYETFQPMFFSDNPHIYIYIYIYIYTLWTWILLYPSE